MKDDFTEGSTFWEDKIHFHARYKNLHNCQQNVLLALINPTITSSIENKAFASLAKLFQKFQIYVITRVGTGTYTT